MLADAAAGRHLAQFHREPGTLTESVYLFVESGLRRGNSVVIIAPPENTDRFIARLEAGQFHPAGLRSAGQLELIDAARLMDRVTANGKPEWALFRPALAQIFERVRAFGRGTRVFSEMASLMWQDGNSEGAIRIEELWNALAQTHSFALYCGFLLDTQCEKSYAGPLEELGRTHSDILGTPEDERFGAALDRASKEIFGISLTQMAGSTKLDGARRFPSGQRAMLWVKRNLPLSTAQLAERARRYYQEAPPAS